MGDTLKHIKTPIQKELDEFEKRFKESMQSSVPLLDKITKYIVQKKGKQVRPLLVFLSARMHGEINDKTHIAASLIELLHTATLVHDDVVDDAYERRGFFSINALWKNKAAVLVGDYLLSKGLLLALNTENYTLLQIMSKSVQQMSEGEILQLEKARRLDIDEDVYYSIIDQKTASLIAASCAAGAASIVQDETDIHRMWSFGQSLGMAFQIKDDLFDYGDQDVGKPRGIDIKEKKMTLPLIHTLAHTHQKNKNFIRHTLKYDSKNEAKVRDIIRIVKDEGGIDYAYNKMIQYKDKSLEILSAYPSTPSLVSMKALVQYFIDRKI